VADRLPRLLLLGAFVLLRGVSASAQQAEPWDARLAAFAAADQDTPPPSDGIVFVGSSSIEAWDLPRFFPSFKTINRGISGFELDDTARLVDRLVFPYSPRIVVIYAGDNDIAAGLTPEDVALDFSRLVTSIHTKLPQTRIVFIGLKPSISRWSYVEEMRAANALIRDYSAHDSLVSYIDIDHAMLGDDDKPRPDLFAADGLHLNVDGYRLWSSLVLPLLENTPDTTRLMTSTTGPSAQAEHP
jgi:lysophospholipase L1-like esterase